MIKDIALSFTAIFVAMDIIGILPMYLAIIRPLEKTQLKQTINNSMLVAFLVAVVFVFVGQQLFHYLGISIFDFKIAGGLILLLVALADLVGSPQAANQASGSTGIVPLAVPLITGPGVLTTLILQVGTVGYGVTITALILNYLLAWGILRRSDKITRVIGNDGTVVFSKISAMLLAAISISMIRGGIFDAIRSFSN